ncbi:MadC family VWA domain-containing protein [Gordonia polyisoprenivorans]|uniref:MadC family VWA domain-containing protein n=1 Tax=Gordonia polyisoprenivorans TaxID=84595 RepID=UPI0023001849|nr:VWA domain-containing protein [Gordonia polyisoprenivorans]WCB36352.1 VWA domain-containing protein [Gordonia polyisoprenivorans]
MVSPQRHPRVPAGPRDDMLDRLAVLFGRVLRGSGVAVSPAEVIEIRRVLDIVGGDTDRLRTALRSVSVKYGYETDGFDHAFDAFFDGRRLDGGDDALPRPRGAVADLPDDIEWDEDFAGAGRRIGADEHTDDIGDLLVDDPDARQRHGESAHREENDFTVSGGTESLGVDQDSASVSGGVTYTIEVDEADSSSVGELVGSAARVHGSPLGVAGAQAILDALADFDARRAYGTDGADGLDAAARAELERALEVFVDALAARLDLAARSGVDVDSADSPTGPLWSDQADIDRACHRLVQRMRGAPRKLVRRTDHGGLDMRRTMRAAVATDGVPVQLWRRTTHAGPVRLLLLVDVSLSVRPVAGFLLRLAQTLHRHGERCEVIAFVDRPVRVTDALRRSNDDSALAAVLADDDLDLAATSDYGSMLTELLGRHGDLLGSRTSVIVAGDARSNGFDPRPDLLAEVSRRVHRLAWITPEPRRYWNQTGCALTDYIEYCDAFISARDGAELVDHVDELAAALR